MLDFCAKHKIVPDVELIKAEQLEQVWATLSQSNKEGVRYVIDIQESLKAVQ